MRKGQDKVRTEMFPSPNNYSRRQNLTVSQGCQKTDCRSTLKSVYGHVLRASVEKHFAHLTYLQVSPAHGIPSPSALLTDTAGCSNIPERTRIQTLVCRTNEGPL